jgi:hypothetical protein
MGYGEKGFCSFLWSKLGLAEGKKKKLGGMLSSCLQNNMEGHLANPDLCHLSL